MYTRTLTILATLCALCLIGGCGERAVSPVEPPMAENGTEPAGGVEVDATGDETQETEADAPPAANREDARRAANLVDRGQEALDNGEWPEADEAFLRAVELDPGNADAWIGRGRVLTGLAQPEDGLVDPDIIDEAVQSFSNALDIHGELLEAYYGRAQAYSVLGRAYFMEAGSLGERGMEALENSVDDFTSVLKLEAEHPEALLGRAEVYEAQGEFQTAIGDYNQVLGIIPGNTTAQQGIKRCRAELADAG